MLQFKKIKDFFSKKKKNKNIVFNKKPKEGFAKKRKHLKINFEFLKHFKFLKRKYIPYFFIGAFVFIVIIVILIIGPFFRVKYIEIVKKDDITNMDIAYKALDYLRGKQLFKIDEFDVFYRLKNYQDNIQSVDVTLSLPDTIKVEIGSYKEVFNITINEKNYILLENGTLVPGIFSKNLRLLTIIKNIDKNRFIEYKQIFNPVYIEKINNIIKRFEQNFINIGITNLYYYEIERELHLELDNGALIIFSVDDDISTDLQIEKLAIFNKDYFKINNGTFVYIDLRISNKIFFCPTEIKAQCETNLKGIYTR